MRNVDASIKDGTLTLKVKLTEDHGPSGSGKTIIVGSSDGNQFVDAGKFPGFKFGLNVYKPKK